jgi:hypothetical protein
MQGYQLRKVVYVIWRILNINIRNQDEVIKHILWWDLDLIILYALGFP